jgi:hypothetical protein
VHGGQAAALEQEKAMKLAVVVMSDPKGGEEALGRVFNAMALASEAQRRGDKTEIVFAGAGTRWPSELSKLGHPAGALFQSVRPLVKGASCGCAAVFGATEGVQAAGVPELKDNALEGTPGLASVRSYLEGGWQTMVF